jgi:hypothetical protein
MTGLGASDRPDFATLADWLEGRLDAEAAERVATAVERGDRGLLAAVDWLRGFMRCADALPMRTPPPLVRQQLRQHFGRWSKAKAILEQPVVRLRAELMFDSRMDRPLTAVRGPADTDVIHLAYRSDLADLVIDVHPLPDGQVRLEGQVLPISDSVAPVFEATATGPDIEVRAIDGDELGRFALSPVPVEAVELQVGNGELVLLAPLDLRRR